MVWGKGRVCVKGCVRGRGKGCGSEGVFEGGLGDRTEGGVVDVPRQSFEGI